jgi:hypothetical protein
VNGYPPRRFCLDIWIHSTHKYLVHVNGYPPRRFCLDVWIHSTHKYLVHVNDSFQKSLEKKFTRYSRGGSVQYRAAGLVTFLRRGAQLSSPLNSPLGTAVVPQTQRETESPLPRICAGNKPAGEASSLEKGTFGHMLLKHSYSYQSRTRLWQ